MIARVPLLPIMERSLEPTTRWLRAQGRGVTLSDVRAIADSLTRDIDAWFGDADIVVTPTTAQPPPLVGAFAHLDGEATFRAAAALGAFTAPFNVTGQPAPLAAVAHDLAPDRRAARRAARRRSPAARAGDVARTRARIVRLGAYDQVCARRNTRPSYLAPSYRPRRR